MKVAALLLLAACGGTTAATPPPTIAHARSPEPELPPGAHVVRGTLTFPARAKPGTAIFLLAKRRDEAGRPVGPPLVVDKLTYAGGDLPFTLDETMAMISGTDFSGDVILIARYDTDGDAMTKLPGDFIGQAPAHVPASGVVVHVTTPVP